MAIEPLNSAMSYQAQSVQVKPASQGSKPAAEYTDVSVPESVRVDQKISIVAQVLDKELKDETNKDSQPNYDQLKKSVEQINKRMENSEAIFGIHERTKRVTIKIVDKNTKEVIKELPPEKTLDMIAKIWELAGILVDEKR